jgi:dTMP kinase
MFLVFEGLDGSGKSTLIKGLKTHLEKRSIPYLITREPGGSPLGDQIRELLLKSSGESEPSPLTELLLYEASRAQHVDQVIRPKLKSGTWVLSDRFYASSVAFQAGGRTLDLRLVRELNNIAVQGVHPDLWVLLDLSVEAANLRMAGRELDRIENEARDFHERVRSAYLEEARLNPSQWLVLDASESPEALLNKLIGELEKRQWLK